MKVTAVEFCDMRARAEIAEHQLQVLKVALKKIYNGENDPHNVNTNRTDVVRYREWVFHDQQTARIALGIK